jgi:pimeloyl-ACP methyl ester carboxylesterase
MRQDSTHSEFRSVFVSAADGLKLHARDYGERSWTRLPVVCLPGLTRNAADFHDLALTLSRYRHRPRRVLCVDYRGRGLSDWDRNWNNYDVRVEVADLMAVLAATGIAHAVFVGTSRGGLVAMGLSAARPAAIRAVVLNDIGPVIEAQGLLRIRSYVGKLPVPRTMQDAADILRHIFDARFPALSEEDWLVLASGSWKQDGDRLVPSYDPALMKPLADLDLETGLPDLWPLFMGLAGVPVLAIRGALSDLLTAETLAAMAKAHTGLETLTVAGQGHAPLLRDAPTMSRIASFIGCVEDAPRRSPHPVAPSRAAG